MRNDVRGDEWENRACFGISGVVGRRVGCLYCCVLSCRIGIDELHLLVHSCLTVLHLCRSFCTLGHDRWRDADAGGGLPWMTFGQPWGQH